jgi:Oxidoreductase molybdopterin binding domain
VRPRSFVAAAIIAAALAFASNSAPAADQAVGQSVVVAQSVEETHTIDPTMVEQLPAVEEKLSFLTSHGPEQATYTGALLWSVLDRSGMLGGDRRARVRHTIVVTGHDGYAASLALAEIDPDFEGKQVLLAYRRNGQPIERKTLRLVVPGDHHGGRSVRDVVRIDLH